MSLFICGPRSHIHFNTGLKDKTKSLFRLQSTLGPKATFASIHQLVLLSLVLQAFTIEAEVVYIKTLQTCR